MSWKFPEKCKINTFKHSVLTNQFSRVFFFFCVFLISTESHTFTNLEEIKNLQNVKLLSVFKSSIFQEISKADQIVHFKWKVRVSVLLGILTHPKPPI